MKKRDDVSYLIRMVGDLFERQTDGFRGHKSVREDFLNGGHSDALAVVAMENGHGRGVRKQTLVDEGARLLGQVHEVFKILGSWTKEETGFEYEWTKREVPQYHLD